MYSALLLWHRTAAWVSFSSFIFCISFVLWVTVLFECAQIARVKPFQCGFNDRRGSMAITHVWGFNEEIRPRAVLRSSFMTHDTLSVHELLGQFRGKARHRTEIVQSTAYLKCPAAKKYGIISAPAKSSMSSAKRRLVIILPPMLTVPSWSFRRLSWSFPEICWRGRMKVDRS